MGFQQLRVSFSGWGWVDFLTGLFFIRSFSGITCWPVQVILQTVLETWSLT
jgi:hypothetical protein